MRFSIVIPVYNVADFVQKCIDSVLACDCADCEILLVDDGSTDGKSGAICDENAARHPDLIRVIHQENKGLGGARNTGLAVARGEYLFFVDSDDTIAPQSLTLLSREIDRTHADIYSFPMDQDDGAGTLRRIETSRHYDGPFTLKEHPEFLRSLTAAWARIWRREFFLASGILYPTKVWYEDIRTSQKLFALADSVVTLEEPLYRYLVRPGSIMRNGNVERNREILDAFQDLLGWYREKGLFDTYRRELCRLMVEHLYIAASVRVLQADPRHPLLKTFRQTLQKEFPDYRSLAKPGAFPGSQRLAYLLLEARCYGLLALLFRLKNAGK